MEKEKVKFKDIFTTIGNDLKDGTKRINAEAKEDFKGIKFERTSSKTGWQLWGLALLTPLFLLGLLFLGIGAVLMWDIVFGL